MKKYLNRIWQNAMKQNKHNILSFMHFIQNNNKNQLIEFCDFGVDDGLWAKECADALKTFKVYGVDIVEERLELAKSNGISIILANLDTLLPLKNEIFDVVHANQVIEHVSSVDNFAKEIYRVLKSGGYAVVSTENSSSWCNIFALMMGWQMFSLTNLSTKQCGIGNPFALHKNEQIMQSWTHKTIFSYRGLKEFFEAHSFKVLEIKGAGYFPFPCKLGLFDPRHAHFITVLLQKDK